MSGESKLISPVSRTLRVTALDRSVNFYQTVLGFVATAETEPGRRLVVSGPVSIQLVATHPGTSLESSVVFVEVTDVAVWRQTLAGRQASPTGIEKVNWIKYAVFSVRDPDGHIFWFAQSYQESSPARDLSRQIRKMLPEFFCSSVPAAIAYYQRVLGFHINYADHNIGVMDRDDGTLILVPGTVDKVGNGACYVYVENADRLYDELLTSGANILTEPVSHPWGLRDFEVRDEDGNRIIFGQPFE
jgi:catechol 2,3-dioxygenase-like lactoylglutathione lyase family enzyme